MATKRSASTRDASQLNNLHNHSYIPKRSPGRSSGRLLHISDLPKSLSQFADPLIRTSYRPPPQNTIAWISSLFYPHNEFFNVWTHLLPGLFFLSQTLTPNPTLLPSDILSLRIYTLGTTLCLFLSAIFHLGTNYAQSWLLKLDYMGIVSSITVTNLSLIHSGLRIAPHLESRYATFCLVCAAWVFYSMVGGHRDGPKAAAFRVVSFGMLMATGCSPILHMWLVEGSQGLRGWPMGEVVVMASCYLLAAVVYLVRWPEKYYPETFDVCGASHQLFHVCIATGQVVYYFGLRRSLGEAY